ncbi:amidohydrolase family protein [Geodermatophilus sp. CPCC 206100]|uniref:amidohydrolase family protein n=1 Tax=Geodermatophilus sp. CPCC 206100 TaxID=3020054 RepID=UPI003B003D8A
MTDALIDVHSHIYPPALVRYLRGRAEPPFIRDVDGAPRFCLFPGDRGVLMTPEFTDLDAKLAFMADAGITHAVLSPGNPWLDLHPGAASVELAREVNAELAEMARSAPDRVWAMGLLPNSTVASAIATLADLAALPETVGVMVGTSICGHPLDAPALGEFWAAAAEVRLPVFVHPGAGLAPEATRGFGQALTLSLAFPFETTVAVARLVLAGVFERSPGLRVVAAHGGGALPFLAGRLRRALEAEQPGDQSVVRSLPERAPGLYVDSILFSPVSLRLCADVLGTDRVLFGTDHPFPIADPRGSAIDLADAVGGEDYERVASRNAVELFGLSLEQPTDVECTSAAVPRGDGS